MAANQRQAVRPAGTAAGVQNADGCSGGVSWIYGHVLKRDVPFLYCCDEHDLAYEEGGGWRDRALADRRFRECIHDSGRPVRAWLFWLAVRLAGWLFWERGIEPATQIEQG